MGKILYNLSKGVIMLLIAIFFYSLLLPAETRTNAPGSFESFGQEIDRFTGTGLVLPVGADPADPWGQKAKIDALQQQIRDKVFGRKPTPPLSPVVTEQPVTGESEAEKAARLEQERLKREKEEALRREEEEKKRQKQEEEKRQEELKRQEEERERKAQEEADRVKQEQEEEKRKQKEQEEERLRLEGEKLRQEEERKKQEEAERQKREQEEAQRKREQEEERLRKEQETQNQAFEATKEKVNKALDDLASLETGFPAAASRSQVYLDLQTNKGSGKNLSEVLKAHQDIVNEQKKLITEEKEKLQKAEASVTEALAELQVSYDDALTDATKQEDVKNVIAGLKQQQEEKSKIIQDKITALETEKNNLETSLKKLETSNETYNQKQQVLSSPPALDTEPSKETFKKLSEKVTTLKDIDATTLITIKDVAKKIAEIDDLLKTGGDLESCQSNCNNISDQLQKKMEAAKEIADLFAASDALAAWAATTESSRATADHTKAKDAYDQYNKEYSAAKFDELKKDLEAKRQELETKRTALKDTINQKKTDHAKFLANITNKKTEIDNLLVETITDKPRQPSDVSGKNLADATAAYADFITKAQEYNKNVTEKQNKLAQLIQEHDQFVDKAQEVKKEILAIDNDAVDAGNQLPDQAKQNQATQKIPEKEIPETEITPAQNKLNELQSLPKKIEEAKKDFDLQKQEFETKKQSFAQALQKIDTDTQSTIPDAVADDKKSAEEFNKRTQELTALKNAWEQKRAELEAFEKNTDYGTAILAQQASNLELKINEYNTLFSGDDLTKAPGEELSFENKTGQLKSDLETKRDSIKNFIAQVDTALTNNNKAKTSWETAEAERKRLEDERQQQEQEEAKRLAREQEDEKKKQEAERKRLEDEGKERQRLEEEERAKQEQEQKEEQRKQKEEERERKEQAAREKEAKEKKLEEEKKREEDAERKRLEEKQQRQEELKKQEEERLKKESEEAERKKLEDEEMQRQRLEEERKKQEQKEKEKREREEQKKREEAEQKRQEEEKQREEEAERKEREEKKRQEVETKKNEHQKFLDEIEKKKKEIDTLHTAANENLPAEPQTKDKSVIEAINALDNFIKTANEHNEKNKQKKESLNKLVGEYDELVRKAGELKSLVAGIDATAAEQLAEQNSLNQDKKTIPESNISLIDAQSRLKKLQELQTSVSDQKTKINEVIKDLKDKATGLAQKISDFETDDVDEVESLAKDAQTSEQSFADQKSKLEKALESYNQKKKELEDLGGQITTANFAEQKNNIQNQINEYKKLFSDAGVAVEDIVFEEDKNNTTEKLKEALSRNQDGIAQKISGLQRKINENNTALENWKKAQEEENRKQKEQEELKRQEEQKRLEEERKKREQEEERKKTEKKNELNGLKGQLDTSFSELKNLKTSIDGIKINDAQAPTPSGKKSINEILEAYKAYQTEIERHEKDLEDKNQKIAEFNSQVAGYNTSLENFEKVRTEATGLAVDLTNIQAPSPAPTLLVTETSEINEQTKGDVTQKIEALSAAQQAWSDSGIKTVSENLNAKITGNTNCYKVQINELEKKIKDYVLPADNLTPAQYSEQYKKAKSEIEQFDAEIKTLETTRSDLETEKNNFQKMSQELKSKLESFQFNGITLAELEELNALTISDFSPTTELTNAKQLKLNELKASKAKQIEKVKKTFTEAHSVYEKARKEFDTAINEVLSQKALGKFGGSAQIVLSSTDLLTKYSTAVKAKNAAEKLFKEAQEAYNAYTKFLEDVSAEPDTQSTAPVAVDPNDKIDSAFNAVKNKIGESVKVWEKEKKEIDNLANVVEAKYNKFLEDTSGFFSGKKDLVARIREHGEYQSALQNFNNKIEEQEVKDQVTLIQNIHTSLSGDDFKSQKKGFGGVISSVIDNPREKVSKLNMYFQGLGELLKNNGVDVGKAQEIYKDLVKKQQDEELAKKVQEEEKKKQEEVERKKREEREKAEAEKKAKERQEKQQKITEISQNIKTIEGELQTIKNNFETQSNNLRSLPQLPSEQKKTQQFKDAQAAINAYQQYKNNLETQTQSYNQKYTELENFVTSYAEKIAERNTLIEELKKLDSAAVTQTLPVTLSLPANSWSPSLTSEGTQNIITELGKKNEELSERMTKVNADIEKFKTNHQTKSKEVEQLKGKFAPAEKWKEGSTVSELEAKRGELAGLKNEIEKRVEGLGEFNEERERIQKEREEIKNFWKNSKVGSADNIEIKIAPPSISTSDRGLSEITSLLNGLRKNKEVGGSDGLLEQVEKEIKKLETAITDKKLAEEKEKLEAEKAKADAEKEKNELAAQKAEHEKLVAAANEKLNTLHAAYQKLSPVAQAAQGEQATITIDSIIESYTQDIEAYKTAKEAFEKEYETVDACYEKITESRKTLDAAVDGANFLDDAEKADKKAVGKDSTENLLNASKNSIYTNILTDPQQLTTAEAKLGKLQNLKGLLAKDFKRELEGAQNLLSESKKQLTQLAQKASQAIPEKGSDGKGISFNEKFEITTEQIQSIKELEKLKDALSQQSLNDLEEIEAQIKKLIVSDDLKQFKPQTTDEYNKSTESYKQVTVWNSEKTTLLETIGQKITQAQAKLQSNKDEIKKAVEKKKKEWEESLTQNTTKLSNLDQLKEPTLEGKLSVVKKGVDEYVAKVIDYNRKHREITDKIEKAKREITKQEDNFKKINNQIDSQPPSQPTPPQQTPAPTKGLIDQTIIDLYTKIQEKLNQTSTSYGPLKQVFDEQNKKLSDAYTQLASTQSEIEKIVTESKENIFADTDSPATTDVAKRTNITQKIKELQGEVKKVTETLTAGINTINNAKTNTEGAKKKIDQLFEETDKEIAELIKNAQGEAASTSQLPGVKITPDDDLTLASPATGENDSGGQDIKKTFEQIKNELNDELEKVNKRIELKGEYNLLMTEISGLNSQFSDDISYEKLLAITFNNKFIETLNDSVLKETKKLTQIKNKIKSSENTTFLSEEEKKGYLGELAKQEKKLEDYNKKIENARKSRALIKEVEKLDKLSKELRDLKNEASPSLDAFLTKKKEFETAQKEFKKALVDVPAEFKNMNYSPQGESKKKQKIEQYCKDLEESNKKITEFFQNVENYKEKIEKFPQESFTDDSDGLMNYYKKLQDLKTFLGDSNSDYSLPAAIFNDEKMTSVDNQIKQQAITLIQGYLEKLPKDDEEALNYLDSGEEAAVFILEKAKNIKNTFSVQDQSINQKMETQEGHRKFAEYLKKELAGEDKKSIIQKKMDLRTSGREGVDAIDKNFSHENWLHFYLKALSKIDSKTFEELRSDNSFDLLKTALIADTQRQQLSLEKTYFQVLLENKFFLPMGPAAPGQKNFLHELVSSNNSFELKDVHAAPNKQAKQEWPISFFCTNYKNFIKEEGTRKSLLMGQDAEGDTALHKLIKKIGSSHNAPNNYDQATFEPILNWLSGSAILTEGEISRLLNTPNKQGLTPLGQAFISCPQHTILDTFMIRMGWRVVQENSDYSKECSSICMKTKIFLENLSTNRDLDQNQENKELLSSYFKAITDRLEGLYARANKSTPEDKQKAYRYFYLDGENKKHEEDVVPKNYYLIKAIKTGDVDVVRYFGEKFRDVAFHDFGNGDHVYLLLKDVFDYTIMSQHSEIIAYIFNDFFKNLHKNLQEKNVKFIYRETNEEYPDPICHLFDKMIAEKNDKSGIVNFLKRLKDNFHNGEQGPVDVSSDILKN